MPPNRPQHSGLWSIYGIYFKPSFANSTAFLANFQYQKPQSQTVYPSDVIEFISRLIDICCNFSVSTIFWQQNKITTDLSIRNKPMRTAVAQPIVEIRSQDTLISNLPRFNKDFIGIGKTLQQKKRERRIIQQEEQALANRVLFLQKQEERAQKTLSRKKTEFKKLVNTIDRNEQHKQQKDRLRQLRQSELEALRQENRHKRLIHKQVSQNAKFNLYLCKKGDHEEVKQMTKSKEKERRQYSNDLNRRKRDHWTEMNISKEKGKQKIDRFYKKKNTEHTIAYMQMIQREEQTKQQKANTIKHLEQFESALKQRLEQSTMRVSQMEEKIMKKSRTIEPPKRLSMGESKVRKNLIDFSLPYVNSNRYSASRLSNDSKNEKNSKNDLSYLEKSLTDRNTPEMDDPTNNEEQIEERIGQQKGFEIPDSSFKIIRTQRKRKNKNKYKEYIF